MKKVIVMLSLLLVSLVVVSRVWAGDPLTAQERAWLKQHGVITVGAFNDYPSFGFVDEHGQAQGISIDYWRLLAATLGFTVEFYPTRFSQQLEGLKSGRFDSLAGIFPLKERAAAFDFSRPYFEIGTYIFVRPQYAHVGGFKNLENLSVGVVKGDSGQILSENAGLKPKTFASYSETIMALAQGEVDAIVMDEPVVAYIRAKNKLGNKIKRVGPPVDEGKMTLPVKKGNTVLLGILNKGVAEISPGQVPGIADKWSK